MALQHIFRTGATENLLYVWFSAMHTRVDIALVHPSDEEALLHVAQSMANRIGEIERMANCFDPASELSRYNAALLQHSQLSPEMQHILSLCDEWKQRTDGLFDVAYGGIVNLSGFLKGYALDALRAILQQEGISNALVNMGNSSVLALGNAPGTSNGWSVTNTVGQEFVLHDECLTTSGNDSPTRCHIMNPLTGQMITGQRQVSVVTPTGTEGEVTATVQFITENQ